MITRLTLCVISFFFSGVLVACQTVPAQAESFSFIVMGDMPYREKDEAMLAKAIPAITAGDYPFIVHVGDYKGGGAPCISDHDVRQQDIIQSLAPTPVFYTPGDNEWTDCDRFKDPDTGKDMSDLKRLEIVRSLFFSGQAPKDFGAVYQDSHPENAHWSYGAARFVTLHVVGTNNGRNYVTVDDHAVAQAAVDARDAANLSWLSQVFDAAKMADQKAVIIAMQSDMTDVKKKHDDVICEGVSKKNAECDGFTALRAAIRDQARGFDGHVLLIHGDTSPFTLGQTFAGEEAPNLWRLNAAGDSGERVTGERWGTRDVTHVTVDFDSETVFTARGLLTDKKTKTK